LSKSASLRVGEKNSMYGKKHKLESIEKNRQSNLGKLAWNKGKHFSEETKKKMSEAKQGFIPWNKGLKIIKNN
jgi:hypothetical protein